MLTSLPFNEFAYFIRDKFSSTYRKVYFLKPDLIFNRSQKLVDSLSDIFYPVSNNTSTKNRGSLAFA